MCKKLTKLVSESEAAREELARYHTAFGEIDAIQSHDGRQIYGHGRQAEVKVHLKLVEEEATLLSRRIVELEVENRGLRAEMSDLREKMGRREGGEEEEEEERQNRNVQEGNLLTPLPLKVTDGSLKTGCTQSEQAQDEGKRKGDVEVSLLYNQSQSDGTMNACHITREGPVGGERAPSDSPENDYSKNLLKGLTTKDYETLLALRDHSCILTSAIQLLMTPPKNGHCSSPSGSFTPPAEVDLNGKVQKIFLPGPLSEALELLQAMLLAFVGRLEMLLTGENLLSDHKDSHVGDSHSADHNAAALKMQDCVEDLRTTEVKEREKQMRQGTSHQLDLMHSCRDPKMRLSLQILQILHQWCQVKGPRLEGKQVSVQLRWM